MSPLHAAAFVSLLKKLASTLARKVGSALATTSGNGRLPTNAQLLKMGPQVDYTRGYPVRTDW